MARTTAIVAIAIAALATAASAGTVADMRWHRRVLLVAAPDAADPALRAQRAALAGWGGGAADRDVSVVEIVGDRVRGADDAGASLRSRYGLDGARFAAVLIGKDGHEAARSPAPLPAATLARTIDAMPMRRAGRR